MRALDPEQTPQELKPATVNAKALFRAGAIAFALGLVVLLVLHLTGHHPPGRYAWVAVSGLVLGELGYWWAHHQHLIDDDGMSG